MRSEPLYLRLKEQIREDLLAGRARGEGDRLATLNELQIQYDASRPTISKALTALAAEGLLVKEAGRGTFALAPASARDANPPRLSIGFIAPLTRAELPQNAFRGIDLIAHRRSARVLMASAGDSVEHERVAAHDLAASGVRGLIIYPTVRQGRTQEGDYLVHEDLGVPVVLIDTCTPEQGHAQVRFDNKRAGFQMTQWLLEQGHKRIGVITYREEAHHPSLEARYKGYREALQERGVAYDPALVQRIPPGAQAVRLEAVIDEMLALASPPTAIVAAYDPLAVEVIQYLAQRGVSVPDQITVVGFDNNTQSRHFQPAFSTTAPDFEAMGEIACEMLLDAIESGQSPSQTYILPVPLLVRSDRAQTPV
ncbi:putative transcription regulator [Capsulimonas corticalis]|uniref:Transcription regulator n=1 Tax=Capsulimonas corticalis TaxID=2219043 RepID=A0A402CR21_9BACT|nr:GntR family transcriptional regulator [Capsulimonas corticalis]BDI34560.1 putative transcription regulator [Capsulimonas corticalis]